MSFKLNFSFGNDQIVYESVFSFLYIHLAGIYGLYLAITKAMWPTLIFETILWYMATLGITAGAHRLWSHRAYKAKMPLQILLMLFQSVAVQFSVENWVRDHRLHHRYSDTDADPHNASRGLFFSHIGWLLVRKHPELKKRGKEIDMSDIQANPVLQFQKKYALPLTVGLGFVLPTLIPVYFWGESLSVSWHVCALRYIWSLNVVFMINSFAHKWGNKPYDKRILSANNNILSLLINGEGFHNYHHVFPWNYRTAELGNNMLNLTTLFIDAFAKIGWAYDLKTVSEDVAERRAKLTGDGTDLWGFNNEEIST